MEHENFAGSKNLFFVGWKKNAGWKKNSSVEKKCQLGNFPLPETDMSGMSGIPGNARPKNGRGGKKRPRAFTGGGKEKKVLHLEKKGFL